MSRPAPARTGTTIRISLGLASIELSLYSRTTDYKVERKEFRTVVENDLPVDHPVGRKAVDTVTGEEIPFSEITRKVVTESGYAELSDEELDRTIGGRIVSVQPMHTWATGNYVPKASYVVEPKATTVKKRKVVDPVAATALAGILAVLAERKAVAVLEYASRGNPHVAVLLPTGILWEVCYAEEVREARPAWTRPEVDEERLGRVRSFLGDLWSTDPVIPENTAVTRVRELAEERASQGARLAVPTPLPVAEAVDFGALFQSSIDAARKAS